MEKLKKAGAAMVRGLFFDPLAIKWCMLVVMLFAAVPMIHAVIAPYIKLFLLWGVAVGVSDIFRTQRSLRNPYAIFWILFTASYCMSIVLNRAAGISANLPDLAYMVLFFFVLFPYDCTQSSEKAEREVRLLARTFTIITFLLSVCCLLTLLFGINYKTTFHIAEEYGTPIVIGVSENRLYGIYNCNTGSALSAISVAFGLLLIWKKGALRCGGKVFQWINIAVQVVYLILTLSRTAWYMFLALVALFVFFVVPVRRFKRQWAADLLKGVCAVAISLAIMLLNSPVKTVMGYAAQAGEPIGKAIAHTIEAVTGVDISGKMDQSGVVIIPDPPKQPLSFERVENVQESGILTGRTQLWKGGLHTFLEHPLFGTTRAGMYDIASKYVSGPLQENLRRGGLHNIAIMVLACSGGVGFLIVAAFLALSVCRALRQIWRRRGTEEGMLLNFLGVLLVTMLGMEMLEARLLYTTTIFGVVFWMMYGYAMWLTDATEPELAACCGVWNRIVGRNKQRE